MANTIRYGKPSMTNLPSELASIIFEEFKNAPRVDDVKMDREVEIIESRIKEARGAE